jgi:signal peptidase I
MRGALVLVAVAALVGTGAATAVRASGLAPFRVTTGSMAATIKPGDWVLESGAGEPRRGDVVLFRYPLGSTGRAVKRVVAVAGDAVAFTEYSLTVNGRTTRIAGSPLPVDPARERETSVPAGHVFLLGDNTAGSYDSRGFGSVPEREIVGEVQMVIPAAVVPAGLAAAVLLAGGLALAAHRRRRS